MEETENRTKTANHLQPYQFKKGQSGNPGGRPAGKSLKDYTREMLSAMTEEERQEFIHGLPKEVIWKMSEGNPHQDTNVKGELKQTHYIITRETGMAEVLNETVETSETPVENPTEITPTPDATESEPVQTPSESVTDNPVTPEV